MTNRPDEIALHLIDALYVEAMVLADEARAYFDYEGEMERQQLEPHERVLFSCESLKVTTRLMHVISWLMHIRSVASGENRQPHFADSINLLDQQAEHESEAPKGLPLRAQAIIGASVELYLKACRLDDGRSNGREGALEAGGEQNAARQNPAHALLERIEKAL